MITLKEWMEVIDYRITEGSEYGWECFGDNTYSLSFWNQDQDGCSANVVFDTKTQEVFIVEVCDYKKDKAYRLINSEYREAYSEEVSQREDEDYAWDCVPWIDLEVDDDWIQKAQAIIENAEYDERVEVPLELDRDEMYELMKLAHERDLTLNELVEEILREKMEELSEAG